MYLLEETDYFENRKKRQELKERGFISSVFIATKIRNKKINVIKYDQSLFRKLNKLAKTSGKYCAVQLNIGGIIKYWYKEDQLNDMLQEIGAIE